MPEVPPKGPVRGRAARGLEMRRKVLDLRVMGVTFETIGRQLGVSRQVAHRHYQRAMLAAQGDAVDLAAETAELTRRRLDALVSAHWVNKGKARSAEVIIRTEALRMRLEGTEAPTRLEHTGKDGKPIEVAHSVLPLELLTDEELAILEEISLKVAARSAARVGADARPTATA